MYNNYVDLWEELIYGVKDNTHWIDVFKEK